MRAHDLRPGIHAAERRLDHLVRHGIREQDHQVRGSDAVSHAGLIFAENLGAAPVLSAEVPVAAFHTFISADDDNTHTTDLLSLQFMAIAFPFVITVLI